ncbi:hypothetical protein AC578_3335 [Pseudocercospora eumusae]|uniref:Cytochrome P450 n=1 Tax=Pseudocercospora eumusae TaxID=321146 RepID=A0A139HD44_9PEZI|nr:hypothetical protein AC578_3335 [Pseudocercospora eumusae]
MLPLLLSGLLVAFVLNIIYKRASLASRRKVFQQRHGCQPPKQYLAAPWWDQYGLNLMRNMLVAAKKRQLLEYVQHLTQIHDPERRGFGNFVAVGRFGTRQTVFTSDPENMKSVLTRADDFVVEPSRLAAFEGLLGKGIFTSDGAFWQHSRNMLKPQFDKSQVTELEQFERHVAKLLALIPDAGSTIDLQPLFHRLTMDTSTEFLTGTSANSLDAEDEASQEATDFVTAFELAMEEGTLHARLGKLYNLFPHPAARRANALSRGFIQKWVDRALKNKAERAEKAKKGEQYVFIDELVKHDEVDRTRALNETMNILLAGRDTTATLLSHLFFNLAREPEVWSKLLAEIDELNGELPSYEKLRDMKYLRYCTQETLRLYPPVPMLSKAASRDTTIPHGGGSDGLQPLFIAKGDTFFYSSYALQRSEAVYGKDAHIFRPERWSDPNLRPFWAYIPFGGGQRCAMDAAKDASESPLGDLFLTREEHLEFRSCAKLHCALGNVLPRPPGQSASTTASKREKPGTRQYLLSTHTGILVRKDEVVSVVFAGTQIDQTNHGNDVIKVKHPKIVISGNQDPDDSTEKSWEYGPQHKIWIEKIDVTGSETPSQDVVIKYINDLMNSKSKGKFKHIDFIDHVKFYFQNLRDVHVATTMPEYNSAVRRLRHYVYLACHPKMLSRFASGSKTARDGYTTNFWEILTRPATKMPPHSRHIALPDHFKSQEPNEEQAKIIRHSFARGGYSKMIANMKIYDTNHARIRFQAMLRDHLIRAKTALDNLSQAMQTVARDPKPEQEAALTTVVKKAANHMVLLLDFLKRFSEFLEAHLQWLAQSANVTHFKDQVTWTEPKPQTVQTPLPGTSEDPKQKSSSGAEPQPNADDLEGDDPDDDTANFDAILNAEKHDSNPYRAWAMAAIAFLRTPCLHESYLRRATVAKPGHKTKSQKYESAVVTQAQVVVAKFKMTAWDNAIAPIDEAFLKKLCQYECGLRPDFLFEALEDSTKIKIGKVIQQYRPSIKGTTHCESTLMSLIAIVKNEEIMKHINDVWLEHNGVFATQRQLLEMLPDVIEMIQVSKKHCPPCEVARCQMSLTGITTKAFIGPGYHTKWSGVLLPAIMPRKLGEPVINAAKRDLALKLLQWQRILEAEEETKKKAEGIKQDSSPLSEEDIDSPERYADVEADYDWVPSDFDEEEAAEFGLLPSTAAQGDDGDDSVDTTTMSMDENVPPSTLTSHIGNVRKERDFTNTSQGNHKREKGDENDEG